MTDQEQWLEDRLEYAERQIELLTEARDTMGALWAREKETRHAAEAKLAKAVEAIREMIQDADYPNDVWKTGTATLAELEKTQ
jgi:hypothetical protein